MSDATSSEPKPPADWRHVHAYGLPEGSVRALMALLIFGTLWGSLILRPDREIPESLRDLLFIVLGHYFAVRKRTAATEPGGPPPLYLPRGTIRLLLIAGFVAVTVVLFRHGQLTHVRANPGVLTLVLVSGFLLGVVVQKLASWWSGAGRRVPRVVEDVRATVSLVAAVLLAVLVWDQLVPFLPAEIVKAFRVLDFGMGRYGPEHVLAAVVGFYFGSRS
jgi:hypothetical protein